MGGSMDATRDRGTRRPATLLHVAMRQVVRDALADIRVAFALRHCDRVGVHARLRGRPFVQNLGRIAIGEGFRLESSPVVSHLVTGRQGEITIGDAVTIGHGAAITSYARIEIHERVSIGAFGLVMDTDFHEAGDRTAGSDPKPITIHSGARIGNHVTILRGATIGEGAVVMDGSVVSGDVAANSCVAGVPARAASSFGAEAEPGDASTAHRVRRVVMRTFGLSAPPADLARPDGVEGWDSLGMLNLLLSLEAEFQVVIEPEDLLPVRRLGDLFSVVERARPR